MTEKRALMSLNELVETEAGAEENDGPTFRIWYDQFCVLRLRAEWTEAERRIAERDKANAADRQLQRSYEAALDVIRPAKPDPEGDKRVPRPQ